MRAGHTPRRRAVARGRRAYVLVCGVVGRAFVQWFYFLAIHRRAIGSALLIEYLAPLLVALWSRFAYHDPARRRIWAALGLALLGLALFMVIKFGKAPKKVPVVPSFRSQSPSSEGGGSFAWIPRYPGASVIDIRTKVNENVLTYGLDFQSGDAPADIAQLQFRASTPLMALVLTLIAVPLSRLRPRQGRYARVGFAIVVYFVYSNLLSAAKVWLEKGDLAPAIGVWWVHLAALALGLYLLVRDASTA